MSLSSRIDQALSPAPDPRRIAGLTSIPFAHRGLHGGAVIENSRAAFQAAIDRGHGIELDVQVSRDGEAFVFHDEELGRLADGVGTLGVLTSVRIGGCRLKGCSETIPTLSEILRLIDGRVPLLIEVKAKGRRVRKVCRAVRRALEGYGGTVAVMSFNPLVGRWYRLHARQVTRGLVVTEQGRKRLRGWGERRFAMARARPDFLAYEIRDLPSRFAGRQRARGLPVLTWTVRTSLERERADAYADQVIYEDV